MSGWCVDMPVSTNAKKSKITKRTQLSHVDSASCLWRAPQFAGLPIGVKDELGHRSRVAEGKGAREHREHENGGSKLACPGGPARAVLYQNLPERGQSVGFVKLGSSGGPRERENLRQILLLIGSLTIQPPRKCRIGVKSIARWLNARARCVIASNGIGQ